MIQQAFVILNETHSLFEQQTDLLNGHFGGGNWETYPVPANSWTYEQMHDQVKLLLKSGKSIVFGSPVPFLQMRLSYLAGKEGSFTVYTFHNDKRGPQPTGWRLVSAADENKAHA